MKVKVKKIKIILIFLFLSFLCFFMTNPYTEVINKLVAMSTLLISLYFIYMCKDNTLLFVISFFLGYSNYSIVMGIYLFPELRPKYLYPQITNIQVYGIGIAMLFLTMLALCIFVPMHCKQEKEVFACRFVEETNDNLLIFLGAFLFFIFILIFGYSRSTSGRGTSSALYEYNVIFLIIMFFYSGNKRLQIILCYCSAVLYVLTSVLNGTRIEALTCMFVVFFCGIRKQIPFKILVGIFLIGIVGFNIIGMFRGDYASLSIAISSSVNNLVKSKLVFDTCTHAYFPMLCMIEQFIDFNFDEASYFLFRFLLTIVMGQSRVTNGNLSSYVSQFYYHNQGGVSLGYFYVWFSYFGAAIFSGIVAIYFKFINKLQYKVIPTKLCLALYVSATVPRWYLYGPWSLLRGVLVCGIIFEMIYIISGIMRKK